jgi:hypothetical protein
MKYLAALVLFALLVGCNPPQDEAITGVRAKYQGYTASQAAAEGYKRDPYCLDAKSLGEDPKLGMMGFHATNEALLRGPIDALKPQALVFDGVGKIVAVEYEIMADAASHAPTLFGQQFHKMQAHPGLANEHYALHLWLVNNPHGPFADFNSAYSCPPGSTPPSNHRH